MLFEPFALGRISLRNRLVMAPMTRNRATADHVPTAIMATYYGARASMGLLITEGVAPSADGAGYARIPGLYTVEQVEAWKPVTQAVHDADGVHRGEPAGDLGEDAVAVATFRACGGERERAAGKVGDRLVEAAFLDRIGVG